MLYCTNPTTLMEEMGLLLLRSEIPSGMCAELHTMAASNNRDHQTRSLSAYAIVTFNR